MPPTRRDVLQTGSAIALGAGLKPLKIISNQTVKICAPADKGLDAAYFARLREKGEPMRAGGDGLKWIGMPIGGICAGQLYLGGDGRFWNWDIFNQPPNRATQNGPTYEHPLKPDTEAIHCRFTIQWGDSEELLLSQENFPNTEWTGQWPIGRVAYRQENCPVEVDLEAFSPFLPLDEETSAMPAICLVYRVKNIGTEPVSVRLNGELENPVLKWSAKDRTGTRRAMPLEAGRWLGVLMDASLQPLAAPSDRADVLVEDWGQGYTKWLTTGTAFGASPQTVAQMPAYQGNIGAISQNVVNSHNVRQGEDIASGDAHTGRLTSQPFVIERKFISFQIGGGRHQGRTCINLMVDNKIVRTQTGQDSNRMQWASWSVADIEGKEAILEIVDEETGAWGNIGIGVISQGDAPRTEPYISDQQGDWGTMSLLCDSCAEPPSTSRTPLNELEISRVSGVKEVAPGETVEIRFVLAWHFPNPWRQSLASLEGASELKRWYSTKWSNAASVAVDAASQFERLHGQTRAWNHTWYEGSLPYWFLERTLIPADALASSTCYRFDNGRFYGWEGNYCCPGTCTHVWGYAQSSGYLFPELERSLRRDVDFGLAWKEDGSVDYRGEYGRSVAHDGQCTMLLRTMRDHLNSPDNSFLTPIWPRVKKSLERMIAEDRDGDGILEGAQYNTLDATWHGPMGWISSLFVAALAAGERMAGDMGEAEFSTKCRSLADRGKTRIGETLFNGEYFIHKPDPAHPEANSTNDGCHIDQVFGASWLRQMGMDGEIDPDKVVAALQSLWKYSFLPDVGPYRRDMKAVQGGRWYAMPGEAGLLMCSWPNGGAERAVGKGGEAWAAGYFNECMNGFEWQVAAHMIAEGMVDEGLAIVRAIHDRYAPEKRNPYNEIECGDHYARSMASHGAYLTACGFQHDGPRGIIGFGPKIGPEDFSCAWTASEGWGRFRQRKIEGKWSAALSPVSGHLRLTKLRLSWEGVESILVRHLNKDIVCELTPDGLVFGEPLIIPAGTTLRLAEV